MNIRAKIFGGEPTEPALIGSKKPRGAKADTLHSVVVPRETRRKSNGRQEDRHRLLDEQVRLTHKGRARKVELINLSGGGAMVSNFKPKLWDRVDLHLGENGTIECAVRWIREERVGLEFAHETRLDCSADEQAHVLRDVIGRSFPEIEFDLPDEQPVVKYDSEQRDGRRHPLIWSGELHHDYQTTPVRLRNISATGSMIECTAMLQVGSEPLLDLGDSGSVFATVMWVVGDHAGLRFREPFDLDQLARSRPEVTPGRWTGPNFLNPQESENSPWAAQWGRMSLGELRQDLEGFLKR